MAYTGSILHQFEHFEGCEASDRILCRNVVGANRYVGFTLMGCAITNTVSYVIALLTKLRFDSLSFTAAFRPIYSSVFSSNTFSPIFE